MSLHKEIFYRSVVKAITSAIGLVSFSAVSFFVAVFVTGLAYFSITDQLTVLDTIYSPDGKLKAVVFREGQSSEYKNVSVLSAKAQLEKNQSGNVFFESCNWVGAKWIDNQRLVIYRDGNGRANRESLNFIAFDRAIDVDFRDLKSK